MTPKLFKKKPRPKGLGFFWSQSQCTTSVPPSCLAQADDIFGDDPNTPV
jgi:hypothetical protein